jgi:hypothetical protein
MGTSQSSGLGFRGWFPGLVLVGEWAGAGAGAESGPASDPCPKPAPGPAPVTRNFSR